MRLNLNLIDFDLFLIRLWEFLDRDQSGVVDYEELLFGLRVSGWFLFDISSIFNDDVG